MKEGGKSGLFTVVAVEKVLDIRGRHAGSRSRRRERGHSMKVWRTESFNNFNSYVIVGDANISRRRGISEHLNLVQGHFRNFMKKIGASEKLSL